MVYGHSLFTRCSFDNNKNKHDFNRDKDLWKKFCTNLKKHATKIINCEEKEMLPQAKKEKKSYKKQKFYHICKKEFDEEVNEDQKYQKFVVTAINTRKYSIQHL